MLENFPTVEGTSTLVIDVGVDEFAGPLVGVVFIFCWFTTKDADTPMSRNTGVPNAPRQSKHSTCCPVRSLTRPSKLPLKVALLPLTDLTRAPESRAKARIAGTPAFSTKSELPGALAGALVCLSGRF